MVNLIGVWDADRPAEAQSLTELENAEDGLAVHAGLVETSWMIYMRPDLVRSEYKYAQAVTVTEWDEYETLPNVEDWPGYFGSPRLARADIGADRMEVNARNLSDLALRIIGGLDHRSLPRAADGDNPAIKRLDGLITDRSSRIAEQQQEWMRTNGIR